VTKEKKSVRTSFDFPRIASTVQQLLLHKKQQSKHLSKMKDGFVAGNFKICQNHSEMHIMEQNYF